MNTKSKIGSQNKELEPSPEEPSANTSEDQSVRPKVPSASKAHHRSVQTRKVHRRMSHTSTQSSSSSNDDDTECHRPPRPRRHSSSTHKHELSVSQPSECDKNSSTSVEKLQSVYRDHDASIKHQYIGMDPDKLAQKSDENTENLDSSDTTEGPDSEFDVESVKDMVFNDPSVHQVVSRTSGQEYTTHGTGNVSERDYATDQTPQGACERPVSLNVQPVDSQVIKSQLEDAADNSAHMISYVADDLEKMIKLSSPLQREYPSSPSGWSMSSSMYSTSSSPKTEHAEYLPPIDPSVLLDLERQSYRLADSLHLMMGNLSSSLHGMSAITVQCLDTYKDAVNKTCDSVDGTIKNMYALMAKTEELGNAMRPVYQLQEQIKEINRILDLFEQKVSSNSIIRKLT